jgi:hypothetical protein
MPITIEYQPSFVTGGQVAYDAGRGRFLQDQDRFNLSQAQFGEQQRQFDQRLQFAAQEAALRDQQLRAQMGQRGAIANAQLQYQDMQQRRSLEAELIQQQMQQEGWEQRNQQQLEMAEMQVNARAQQLQQTQQFDAAMMEKQQIQQYIRSNAAILSPEQIADLTSQWESQYDLPWGFDQQAVVEAQKAQQELAMRQIEEAGTMLGLPDDAFAKGMIAWEADDQGNPVPVLTQIGQAKLDQDKAEKELQNRLDATEMVEETKRRKAEMEHQEFIQEQYRKQEEEEKAQEEAQQKQKEEAAKRQQEFARSSVESAKKAMGEYLSDRQPDELGNMTTKPITAYDWPIVLTKEEYDFIPPGVIFYRNGELWEKRPDGKAVKATLPGSK